jgi:hypothetical protein
MTACVRAPRCPQRLFSGERKPPSQRDSIVRVHSSMVNCWELCAPSSGYRLCTQAAKHSPLIPFLRAARLHGRFGRGCSKWVKRTQDCHNGSRPAASPGEKARTNPSPPPRGPRKCANEPTIGQSVHGCNALVEWKRANEPIAVIANSKWIRSCVDSRKLDTCIGRGRPPVSRESGWGSRLEVGIGSRAVHRGPAPSAACLTRPVGAIRMDAWTSLAFPARPSRRSS